MAQIEHNPVAVEILGRIDAAAVNIAACENNTAREEASSLLRRIVDRFSNYTYLRYDELEEMKAMLAGINKLVS